MKTIFVIGAGSFIGGILRFLAGQFIQNRNSTSFPFATLSVNILGCFFIGIVLEFSLRGYINGEWKLFLATGLLGGFTTYSAFSAETILLLRSGDWSAAALYIGSSIIFGLLATLAGTLAVKQMS